MRFRQRQLLGRTVLLVAALFGGAWLANLDFARKLSSDVLDLIPAAEQAPELTLVRSLAGDAEAKTMLLVLSSAEGRAVTADVAVRFAARLADDQAFDQAIALADPAHRDALGAEVFAQRFTLLFPRWLREQEAAHAQTTADPAGLAPWLAREVTEKLERFLATPEALAFADVVAADPLLLMPAAAMSLQDGLSLVQPAGGPEADGLVWARLAASPLSPEGQGPAFAAIEQAAESLGLTVEATGVNRFAAASRARIEREVKTLNALSLIAVLTVAFTFIRTLRRGLHLVPVILLSILGAWVGSTMIFERLHILVFVVGSLLTGVAIDYGFYLFMQPPAHPGEDYPAKVRRLAKPLLASCLTTVAGFALLLFSDLPFIRQLGVYVGIGLLCALTTAVVYFATVRDPYLETRNFRGGRALPPSLRRRVRRLLMVAWVVALPGLAWITWRDDIRELEIPSPDLQAEDARIRGRFGETGDRTVYLTYGDDVASARTALAGLESWLAVAGGGRARPVGLGMIVPTPAEAASAAEFARTQAEFADLLRTELTRGGFEAEEFTPFFEAYAAHAEGGEAQDLDAALEALQSKLTGPLAMLLHRGRPFSWFVTLVADAPEAEPPAGTRTISTSQLQSLNRIFSRYRESALRLSLVGLGIVGLGVFLTYGLKDGVRIFAIPCGVCLGVFGLFGWLGQPLNLFHLLGAFLGVCMTHNYAIFSATSAYRREPPPVSVRVSALTTAASFGVLATSSIPVVSALGLTVALMVLAALTAIELEHLADLGGKA